MTEDQDNLQELNAKLDKLLKIFEDAMSELKSASSGLSPAVEEKIDKLLEQNGEIADGIDEVQGHSRRWQNATQKIHDELAYVMSQRIQEGQDRVKDVLPRYFSERRPSVHHCMHTEIPFSGYCFTRSSISICGPVMASRPLTTPDV